MHLEAIFTFKTTEKISSRYKIEKVWVGPIKWNKESPGDVFQNILNTSSNFNIIYHYS